LEPAARFGRLSSIQTDGGFIMRDIRSDLQDRANLLRELINAAQAQFERHMDQIKQEHESRLKGMKADLDAVNTLFGIEHRRLGNAQPEPKAQPQPPKPETAPPQPQPSLKAMMGLRRVG
jgi:hypothetical protein